MCLSKRQVRLLVRAGSLSLEDFPGVSNSCPVAYSVYLVDDGFNIFVDRVNPLNERENAFPLLIAKVREGGKIEELCPADYRVKVIPGSMVQVWRYVD